MTDDKHHCSRRRKRRVCLFGLSADPPTGHGGHLGIVAHLASMEMFDEVRVIPVYRHMFAVSWFYRNRFGSFCVRHCHLTRYVLQITEQTGETGTVSIQNTNVPTVVEGYSQCNRVRSGTNLFWKCVRWIVSATTRGELRLLNLLQYHSHAVIHCRYSLPI